MNDRMVTGPATVSRNPPWKKIDKRGNPLWRAFKVNGDLKHAGLNCPAGERGPAVSLAANADDLHSFSG